jgi:hypothetical protein
VGQVSRADSWVTRRGETAHAVRYGITRLRPHETTADELVAYVRGHWGIENRLHGARDVALGEDLCRVRSANAPQALAATRSVAIALLRLEEEPNLAAAMRSLAAHAGGTLRLIGVTIPRE